MEIDNFFRQEIGNLFLPILYHSVVPLYAYWDIKIWLYKKAPRFG